MYVHKMFVHTYDTQVDVFYSCCFVRNRVYVWKWVCVTLYKFFLKIQLKVQVREIVRKLLKFNLNILCFLDTYVCKCVFFNVVEIMQILFEKIFEET